MKNTLIFIVLLTILIVGVYYLGTINLINFNKSIPLMNIENKDCNSSMLSDSAKCLRNELTTFFKYNLSQVGKDLSLEELKRDGGTCYNYANWYKDNLINLGFNATTISFWGEDLGHLITLAWTNNLNNGTYCILDMTNVKCNQMGEINMTLYKELIQ